MSKGKKSGLPTAKVSKSTRLKAYKSGMQGHVLFGGRPDVTDKYIATTGRIVEQTIETKGVLLPPSDKEQE